jgi:hypothetical protein
MAKKIPIGIQDFRKLVENDFLYVDKTAFLYKMISVQGIYLITRPRRFGKSLTLSTLYELYSGNKFLFKGLWIEDKWDWSKQYPILRISLTSIGFQEIGLRAALDQQLGLIAKAHGLQLSMQGLAARFGELISALSEAGNKTVVLIDEYDYPIIHYLGKDINAAKENQEILREFYSVLKDCDALLEFVFLTGVSKFSKTGIFSGLNNLIDLSMHPDYATMLGYTQAELETAFAEYFGLAGKQLKMDRATLLEKIREWYNGYRFQYASEKVYNPVSVNNFFSVKQFENFWFATGTPSFLIHLLKEEGLFDLHLPPVNPGGFDTFDLDKLKPEAILFQTGYLTIQRQTEDGLIQLDYPNKEVRDAMLEILVEGFLNVDVERSAAMVISLRNAFRQNQIDEAMRILQGVFANIPYFLHEKYPEKFFHAAIHLLFTYLSIRIRSEVCTSAGRVDSMVETDTQVFILEFKLDRSPQEALEQIRNKRYYQSAWALGKPVTGIGVNISAETKNIVDWASAIYP